MNCSSAHRRPRRAPASDPRPPAWAAVLALLLLFMAIAGSEDVHAQVLPRSQDRFVQTGVAAVPGIGVQLGYITPRTFYTVEAVVSADATPSFSGGEGSLQVSLGLGGALRPFGVLRAIGNTGQTTYDLDVGLRMGPSLFFPYGESARAENPFSLFLEPYVRMASSLPSGRILFAEAGLQRPILRGGIWLRF